MHIKQVTICGFRSFKDQVVVEPFSEKHNVVVGRNGTGKSNFFDAIRFGLLTNRFANLRQEERQSLLHEGSGKHVMSAYVEIVFDNSDGRLPVDTEEVVLRRTIGVKKDEFFLNRKHIPKGDVIHLLESAGFSRSNPYYIVQQGKVNALALMKDKDRLELLKEVAGTKVYEDRRLESLKIMHETDSRREKIQQVITYIEERLAELEEEKDELKEYQNLDLEKRACEYTILDKELIDIREELDSIEQSRMAEADVSNELHEAARQLHETIRTLEQEYLVKTLEFKQLEERKSEIEAERTQLVKNRYQLELEVRELTETSCMDQEKLVENEKETKRVTIEIASVEKKLAAITSQVEASERVYNETMQHIGQLKEEQNLLIAKQSHKSQFQTQDERDEYLTRECDELNELVVRKDSERQTLCHSIDQLKGSYQLCLKQLKEQDHASTARSDALDQLTRTIQTLKQQRNTLSENKKDKWRQEHDLRKKMDAAKEQMLKGQDAMYAHDVRRALDAIRDMNRPGVYGPLIELIEPMDDRFCTAIDEAAGSSLYHVVVDTDDTAAYVMKELDRKRLGRVTFLPLNRLKIKTNEKYPQNDDVFPLIEKLKYDRSIHKAVSTAFGKKLICRDLNTCNQYASSWNMDCLTLNGDMVHRRGGLNGGYRDPSRSRTRMAQQVRVAERQVKDLNTACEKATAAAELADAEISRVLSELQKQEQQKRRLLDTYDQFQQDSKAMMRQKTSLERNIQAKETLLHEIDAERSEFVKKIGTFEKEMEIPLTDTLSAAETRKLRDLSYKIQSKTKLGLNQKQELESKRLQQISIETLLNSNLKRRLEELMEETNGNYLTARQDDLLQSKRCDLQEATRLLEQNTLMLHQVETNHVSKELESLSSQLEMFKAQDMDHHQKIQQEAAAAETLLNKRSRLINKRTELMTQLREIGTIPAKCADLKHFSLKQLTKRLKTCKKELNKYDHVNKKALDQYMSFNEQRSTLIDRKEELEKGFTSIKELVDVLDKRKDEAILRTFKGVSHHFTQVFSELVPTGQGRMCIVRNENDEPEQEQTVETFIGIQIKVNFRGEGDSYLMQQLSGGQKALVALAFIFAIQRCDPAPFYLFDEIDQALDSTHRAAVAALIHRQANSNDNPAQFITSTFRPEMVKVCDKSYGIGHQHKISNVHTMTREEALEFIANNMTQEEKC